MYPVQDIAAVEVVGKEMFLVLDLLLLGNYFKQNLSYLPTTQISDE